MPLQALKLLTQVCRQVQPVMRKHSWECCLVSEFIPASNRYTSFKGRVALNFQTTTAAAVDQQKHKWPAHRLPHTGRAR